MAVSKAKLELSGSDLDLIVKCVMSPESCADIPAAERATFTCSIIARFNRSLQEAA